MKLFEQVFADDIVGQITNPLNKYGDFNSDGRGLVLFISNILRVFFLVAGMVAFFNFVLAGFQYMTAGGDAKALQHAWDRIWQSLLGLILIIGSFALISFFSYLIFGDAGFVLQPKIYGPPQ